MIALTSTLRKSGGHQEGPELTCLTSELFVYFVGIGVVREKGVCVRVSGMLCNCAPVVSFTSFYSKIWFVLYCFLKICTPHFSCLYHSHCRYLARIDSVEEHLIRKSNPNGLTYIQQCTFRKATCHGQFDHLVCFAPAMLALGAQEARNPKAEHVRPSAPDVRAKGLK